MMEDIPGDLLELNDADLVPKEWKPVTIRMGMHSNGNAMLNVAPRLDGWALCSKDAKDRMIIKTGNLSDSSADWTIWLDQAKLLQLKGACETALAIIEGKQ